MQFHVILGSCSGAGEVMKFSFFWVVAIWHLRMTPLCYFKTSGTITMMQHHTPEEVNRHANSHQQLKVTLSLSAPWRHKEGADEYLHSFLTLVLDGGEWSANTTPWPFYLQQTAPIPIQEVGPRAGLFILEMRKISFCFCQDSSQLPRCYNDDAILAHI